MSKFLVVCCLAITYSFVNTATSNHKICLESRSLIFGSDKVDFIPFFIRMRMSVRFGFRIFKPNPSPHPNEYENIHIPSKLRFVIITRGRKAPESRFRLRFLFLLGAGRRPSQGSTYVFCYYYLCFPCSKFPVRSQSPNSD